MTRAASIPTDHSPDAPLRLDIAARIAFPDGTMGAAGLRKERDKGRLETEFIANKEYTTLAAIQRMRELCRGQRKERASNGETKVTKRTGSYGTGQDGTSGTGQPSLALAAVKANLLKRKNSSQTTSPKSTAPRAPGTVTPIK